MTRNNLISATILALLLALVDVGSAKNVRRGGSRPVKASNVGKSSRVKGIKGFKPQGLTQRGLKNAGAEGRETDATEMPTEVPTEVQTEGVPNAVLEDEDTGIIGGIQASGDEFPFYVKFEGNTLCGGSLISPDTILTAAHCVDQGKPDQVRLGADQYNNGGVVANTQCSVMHENFIENDSTLMNDVAIIKLKQPVTDQSVATIAYNTNTAYPSTSGTSLTVIGFGLTDNGGSVSKTLQKLDTNFVSIEDCMQTYSSSVVTPENHICADVKDAGDCNGDSGGPVFVNGLQVGIVSFGYGGCASDRYQDVYVNVAAYSDWIRSYVDGDNCRSASAGDTTDTDQGDGGGDTGTDNGGGTDVDTTDEEDGPFDFDSLLECFTTVMNVVQGLMGGGDNAKGGNNDNNNNNKGGGEEKNAEKDNEKNNGDNNKGGGKGFLRNFFGGGGEGGEGGIVSNLLGRVHDVLSDPEVNNALEDALGVDSDGDSDGGER